MWQNMAASAGSGSDLPPKSNQPPMHQTAQRPRFAVAWKQCSVCPRDRSPIFKSPRQFCEHLRDFHCTKEGGSFICKYGPHGVCLSLPVEGVNDQDYEDHVARDHVAEAMRPGSSAAPSRTWNSAPRAEAEPAAGRTEPSVVQDQHKWTMYMSKVNLPAALNDPRLARRETDFFSKTWGEGFTDRVDIRASPYLPDISKEHFRKYLKMTMSRQKEHVKNSITVADNLPQDEFPLLRARRPSQKERLETESIPKMFMMANFCLENPDTFNAVFPWSHIEGSHSQGGSSRQSSKLLQEKLSHYLDLVEVQIARQISLRSDAFFHAMTSHDMLEEKMKDTCKTIRILREKIRLMDSRLAKGPIQIMKETRTRANHVMLYNKLKLMSTVHQTQPTIQMLLSSNEYVGALDLIGTTQEVLAQELAGIHSFRHLGSQLAEMEKLIDKMIQGDFVKYVTADLNRPLSETEKLMEEERLVSIVLGMIRQRKFNLVDVYREEACTTIKATIKQDVVEAVAAAEDINNDDNVGSLADQMRLLNYPTWMALLKNVFANIAILLNRVKAATYTMLDVAQVAAGTSREEDSDKSDSSEKCEGLPNGDISEMNGTEHSDSYTNGHSNGGEQEEVGEDEEVEEGLTPDSGQKTRERHPSLRMAAPDMDIMITSEEYEKVSSSLRAMLVAVTNHAHDRCVKLLTARAKDGFLERLTSGQFVLLSRTVEKFVTDCETISGQKSTTLRASLQSQANRFVTRFHEERKTKLTLILDNERWKQAEVPAEFQQLVTHIYTHDRISLPDRKVDPDIKPQEYLIVNGEKYAVVGTVLMLLKMMVEYCQCAEDIPTITPDLLNRVVELLKMFNSRTCQLILGAGALQLVGLKTITTKNLALASRCLQLIVHFIPLISKHFNTHLSVKQTNMLKHFDSVLKDYNDHVAEIANKLLAIMDSMVEIQLSKWEVKPPMPSSSFRSISKQMSKLHEAIVDLLPPKQVFDLFQEIVVSFQVKLRGQLIKLGVTNDGGPQHGLVSADYTFFLENLTSLHGLSKLDSNTDSIWDQR